MHAKNKKGLIIGLAALIILGLLYAGVTVYNKNAQEARKAEADRENAATILLSIEEASLAKISFDGEDDRVVFEQKDGEWYIPGDDVFVMNTSKAATMTSDLAALTITRTLDEPGDLTQYGISAASRRIEVKTTDGSVYEILVGDRNTSTNELYFMLQGDKNVYMTTASLDTHFAGRTAEFAKYEYVPDIEPQWLRKFDVKKSEGSYLLITPGDDNCTVTDENGNVQRASLSIVGSMQQQICNMNWASNVEYDCKDFNKYGLGEDAVSIYVEYGDASESYSFTLYVGDEDDNGDYYVRLNDSKQVHTVHKEYLIDFVENVPTTFWSLTYSFVSIGDMSSLEVTSGGETHVLTRTAEHEGEADEKIEYFVDGKTVGKNEFTKFYYACVSVTAQERTEEIPEVEGEPALELIYKLTDGTTKNIKYYEYDQNFYTVIYENGEKAAHTNKLYVNAMLSALSELLAK